MRISHTSTMAKTVLAAALAAAFAVGCGGSDSGPASPAVTVDQVRTTTPLTKNWRFVFDSSLTDEQALNADATNWSTVSLPHTWNATDAATTAQSTPSTALYKRGVGW
nr:hypothetical protein [uncultured Albidiferax sp.]